MLTAPFVLAHHRFRYILTRCFCFYTVLFQGLGRRFFCLRRLFYVQYSIPSARATPKRNTRRSKVARVFLQQLCFLLLVQQELLNKLLFAFLNIASALLFSFLRQLMFSHFNHISLQRVVPLLDLKNPLCTSYCSIFLF